MTNASAPLSRLNSDLGDLYKDIDYFSTPLNEVHSALDKFERIEKTPKRIKDKVNEIHDVLKSLERACKSAEWIPEVGEEAKVGAETLGGINSFLGEIESLLGDIQKDTDKSAKQFLDLKKPIDKSWAAIASVEGFLKQSETVTTGLLKHYEGRRIPESVNRCSQRLDKPLQKVVQPLNNAKDEAQKALSTAENAIEAVVSGLDKAVGFSDFIENIYAKLRPIRDVVKTIADAVGRAAHYTEEKIKTVLKLGERIFGDTYRKVRGFLDKIEGELRKLKKKFIDWAFKPVRDVMRKAADQIKKQVDKLPSFDPAKEALKAVRALLDEIDKAINQVSQKCADLFSGATQPP